MTYDQAQIDALVRQLLDSRCLDLLADHVSDRAERYPALAAALGMAPPRPVTAPAAGSGAQEPVPSPPAAGRPLNVGAVRAARAARRAQQEAAAAELRARQTPPTRPVGASDFEGRDGRWRWVDMIGTVPGSKWHIHQVASLIDGSPWESVTVQLGAPGGGDHGHADFRATADGRRQWVHISIDPAMSPGEQERTLRHEIGHLAAEVAELRACGGDVGAWRASWEQRARATEAFAVHCETWLHASFSGPQVVQEALRLRRWEG